MTSTGSYEDLFRREITKYDHICEDIAQNIDAQEQLLLQIQVCSFFLLCTFPTLQILQSRITLLNFCAT